MRDHLGNFMVAGNLGFARGVLLLEDCEGTFTWKVTGTGGDDVHAFATAAAFMGLNGMQLKTRTTGAADGDYLTVGKSFGFPESGLLVVRARLCIPAQAVVEIAAVSLTIADGARVYNAGVHIKPNDPGMYYVDVGGAEVAMPALGDPIVDGSFYTVEVVVDARLMQYVEIAANGTRVDLAGVAIHDQGALVAKSVSLQLYVEAQGAAAAQIYVDSVYVGEFLDL